MNEYEIFEVISKIDDFCHDEATINTFKRIEVSPKVRPGRGLKSKR